MEFNPCFFCSSSIYPSPPVGVGASSSLNDNAKILKGTERSVYKALSPKIG